jgi:hypothetical protein
MMMKTIITVALFFTLVPVFSQTAADSVTYWINSSYADCINAGRAVCDCEKENNFLLIAADIPGKKLLVVPSGYSNKGIISTAIKQSVLRKDSFIVSGKEFETGGSVIINETGLKFVSKNTGVAFTKFKVKSFAKDKEQDMPLQLGVFNCKPLLNRITRPCNGENLLITKDSLSKLAAEGQITINCSAGGSHNELKIKNTEQSFFINYPGNKIEMFKQPGRTTSQTIDISVLKECQVFELPQK